MRKDSGKTVLIADDTLPLRVMLEEVLTGAGYKVICACDGVEARDLITEHYQEIDLLVLDLLMPRMSGFEVLSYLQQAYPEKRFPILVVSGVFKGPKEIRRLKELGANGYLNKASVIDDILYRVNSFFHSQDGTGRRHPRVICSLPVEYQYNGTRHSSFITTLSLSGCFIRTLKPAPRGSMANLWISIPDGVCEQPLQTKGRVAWVNGYNSGYQPNCPPGMGLEFKPADGDQLECLKNLVDQKLLEERIWQTP